MSNIIYGRNPIVEAFRAGRKVRTVFISETVKPAKVAEILALAQTNRVRVESVSPERIEELSGTPKNQGVAAIMADQSYASIEEILAKANRLGEPPLVALLDGLEDPHNLGAILRSAEGAGLHGVVIPNRRSASITSTVAKSSAGAAAHVLTARVGNLNRTIEHLKKHNIWIVGADHNARQSYYEADLSSGLGIVIGGEGRGLRRLVREKCDFLVRIPMRGKVNSLNASVAAALIFFEARRQRET